MLRPGARRSELSGSMFGRLDARDTRDTRDNGQMTYQHLLVKRDEDIVTITLNRPEKRNALSLPVLHELTAAFAEVGDSDARGVVLAANGPVFSAGHNFADLAGTSLDDARRLFETCTEMLDTIQEIGQPVCAKVHALATAAGCQLVAACDLAVAAEDAAFALSGIKAGLFCHTPLVAVSRAVGRKRALEMAMTGDPIDARTAADWGLVNRVVPAARLDEETWDLITRATCGVPTSRGPGKQGFYAQIELDQAGAYRHTIDLIAAAAVTPDAQEGIAAFLEKRPPSFSR
jgi:enoyl-CoA hydratase/carnithine racemase